MLTEELIQKFHKFSGKGKPYDVVDARISNYIIEKNNLMVISGNRRKTMNYREEIAEMLNRIQSEKVLRYIWIFVSDICKDLGIKTDE